jgi:hypothetical protein
MAAFLFLLITLRLRFAISAASIPATAAKNRIVNVHNEYRCGMCDTPPMAWSDALATNALDYMNTGASAGHCSSSDGSVAGCVGNGENMYSGAAEDDADEWERAINMWFASEIDCYNFDTGGNTCTAGHMTQVAWDSSTEIGCASNPSATGSMKTLCMYQQPGNFNNQHATRVHKCPTATQYTYYTGAWSSASGYATDTTTSGCPADSSCSVDSGCAGALAPTPSPAPTPAPAPTPTPTPTPDPVSDDGARVQAGLIVLAAMALPMLA